MGNVFIVKVDGKGVKVECKGGTVGTTQHGRVLGAGAWLYQICCRYSWNSYVLGANNQIIGFLSSAF